MLLNALIRERVAKRRLLAFVAREALGGTLGFKLDDVTIIRHPRGRLLVSECGFCKNMPKTRVYEGCGEVEWCNMSYSGFGPQDDCPGALKFRRKSAVDQSALKLAD